MNTTKLKRSRINRTIPRPEPNVKDRPAQRNFTSWSLWVFFSATVFTAVMWTKGRIKEPSLSLHVVLNCAVHDHATTDAALNAVAGELKDRNRRVWVVLNNDSVSEYRTRYPLQNRFTFVPAQPAWAHSLWGYRNDLLQFMANDNPSATDPYYLFLDQCEKIVEDGLNMLEKGVAVFKTPTSQEQGRTPSFFYTDYVQRNCTSQSPGIMQNTQKFVPYLILAGNSSNRPISTSMLIHSLTWQSAARKGEDNSFIDLEGTVLRKTSSCSPPDVFWFQLALRDISGIRIPLSVIFSGATDCAGSIPETTPSSPVETDVTCRSSVASLGTTSVASLHLLAQLKRASNPLVSVIIPFYNVDNIVWFEQTLHSLKNQSLTDFEIIIVDDGSDVRFHQSLLTSVTTQAGLWYGLQNPSSPRDSVSSMAIPVRILTHDENLGLASARNTGVLASRARYVLFLDPDDYLAPTAIEKLVLIGFPILDNPIPHQPSKKNAFVYPGVVHFGDKNDVVYAEFSKDRLKSENYLTATALISRSIYLQVGGMCPREIVRYFEDYDFWLRMTTMGYIGKLLREPLFFYRRHKIGQSWAILKDSASDSGDEQISGKTETWMHELRRNNPVAYGDMTHAEAKKIVSSANRSRDSLPCYRPLVDSTQQDRSQVFKKLQTELSERMRNPAIHPRNHAEKSSVDLFPFKSSHFRDVDECPVVSVLYCIPWMVSGGADLYDLHVLESLRTADPVKIMSQGDHDTQSRSRRFHVTLLVERHIMDHSWMSRFEALSDETFNIQVMTNDTEVADQIFDYLVQSRNVQLVITRGTVIGYRSIQRWNAHAERKIPFLDILHLQNPSGRTDWEWRAGQVHQYLNRRVVVSHHLRSYLVESVGKGDVDLGKNETWQGPLDVSETEKFNVIYPAVDFKYLEIQTLLSPHSQRSTNVLTSGDGEERKRLTVMFVGRLESQKNPFLWLKTVRQLHQLRFSTARSAPPNYVMVGNGYLGRRVQLAVQTDPEYAQIKPYITFTRTVSHDSVLRHLVHSSNTVLLMTSDFEGVPIVMLEALALGVPVVATESGGMREVMEDKELLEAGVVTGQLFRRQDSENAKENDDGFALRMAEQVQSLFSDMESGQLQSLEGRYSTAEVVRRKYGIERFMTSWRQLAVSSLHGSQANQL